MNNLRSILRLCLAFFTHLMAFLQQKLKRMFLNQGFKCTDPLNILIISRLPKQLFKRVPYLLFGAVLG